MTGTPQNIVDLLPGNINLPIGDPLKGLIQKSEENHELFGNIINSLLSIENQKRLSLSNSPINILSTTDSDELLPEQKQFNPVLDNIINESNLKSLIGDFEIADEILFTNEETTKTAPERNENNTEVKGNILSFNKELTSLLPVQTTPYQQNIKDIINKVPFDVEAGKYEIVDSQITDGKLNLEVVLLNQPEQKIKLSIPTELLHKEGNVESLKNVPSDRIELDTISNESSKFEEYISRLNLKEIEITTINSNKNPQKVLEPVNVNLIAESDGHKIFIKGKLNKNSLRISSPLNKKSIKTPVVDDRSSLQKNNDFMAGSEKPFVRETQHVKNRVILKNDNINIPEHIKSFKGNASLKNDLNKFDSFFSYELLNNDLNSGEEKINVRHVRFTLPENIKTMLKPNGQAVTIRIEPAHLGPAKLSLSIRNDKLRARVMVNSIIAKTTLESSLDRLVEQLSKADIKVDNIEISLNGDSAQNEFSRRQANWRRPFSNHRIKLDDALLDNITIPVQPSRMEPVYYAGSGGVNLLA